MDDVSQPDLNFWYWCLILVSLGLAAVIALAIAYYFEVRKDKKMLGKWSKTRGYDK